MTITKANVRNEIAMIEPRPGESMPEAVCRRFVGITAHGWPAWESRHVRRAALVLAAIEREDFATEQYRRMKK